jgi:hypothetical protein
MCKIRQSSQWHHRFPQFKSNIKQYGEIINEPFNLLPVCSDCHASHASIDRWAIWSERDFREQAAARGYILPEPKRSMKK